MAGRTATARTGPMASAEPRMACSRGFTGSLDPNEICGASDSTPLRPHASKKTHEPGVSPKIGAYQRGYNETLSSVLREDVAVPVADAGPERLVRLRDKQGFDAFKWRVAAECGRDIDEWPGRTEAIVPRVARALGSGVAKLVDANSGYSPARAIEVGRLLEAEGIGHFEEPCPYWKLEQTRLVSETLELDVAGGEQDWDLATWARMIGMRAVDIVQPDVMYMGGMSRTLQVAGMAANAGLPVTPHSANLSLVTMCTMHLLGAIPNAGKYLEFSIEGADYYPWQEGLFLGDPYAIEDGSVSIPSAPGWGVEINPEWLERAVYQCSQPLP